MDPALSSATTNRALQLKVTMMSHGDRGAPRRSKLGLLIKRLVFLVLPVLVLVGAVAGNLAMGAFAPQPEEKEEVVEALPVLTAPVQSESVQLFVRTQGEVRPRSEVMLASEVGGRVVYVAPTFLEGGQFSQGETLVSVDDAEFALRVVQANANVAQAETALARELSEAESARNEAEQLEMDNISSLALREPQLAEARAALASAKAARDEAQLHLSRTTITAPFNGRVRERAVNIGAFISPGSKLGEIYATDIVDVPIPLTNKDLASLGLGIGFVASTSNPGPNVTLSAIIGDTPQTWTGRITRTDSRFDPETRVLFGYVEVKDPYGSGADNGTPLATGLFVNAEIVGRDVANSLTIPRTALRGKDVVYVASDDQKMEIRRVNVASSDRARAVITSGLETGERVITSPVKGAADGMQIRPVDRLEVTSGVTGSAENTSGEN